MRRDRQIILPHEGLIDVVEVVLGQLRVAIDVERRWDVIVTQVRELVSRGAPWGEMVDLVGRAAPWGFLLYWTNDVMLDLLRFGLVAAPLVLTLAFSQQRAYAFATCSNNAC